MALIANVDEKGILKIRSLIARYGLKDFLQAVELEMIDIISGAEGEELQIAKKVEKALERIVG